MARPYSRYSRRW